MYRRTPSIAATILLFFAAPVAALQQGSIVKEKIDPYSFQPENTAVVVDAETVDIPQIFDDLDPVAREWYQHVMTLSNPWFEGRAPGSDGIERAAEYVEFWFERNGLEPAFPGDAGDDDDWTSYRQSLELPGGRPRIIRAEMSIDGRQIAPGKEFAVLGNSGDGEVRAPLAFAGYAIGDGPDGYSSFDEDDSEASFEGRIVLVFRYEPLDEEGRSQFTRRRFSSHASIPEKMKAVADRGAAGIVLVNPPGALFAKDGLEDGPNGRFGDSLDIPVIQVTPEIAERMLVASGVDPVENLKAWRLKADEGGHGATLVGDGDAIFSITTEIDGGAKVTSNIGGVLRGRGSLADEWVVIGGHYDHVGYGDFGAMPTNRGRLHPGADDDASGTAAVIMLSKSMAEQYADADDEDLRSILFLAFTAEESGLIGSRYYVEHPTLPAGSINAMINMDMVGRLRDDTLAVGGVESAVGMLDRIRPDLEASGLDIVADPNGRGPSDHASFYGAGIPVLFFFTGTHDVYHRPGDFGWTVNPRGAAKVIDLADAIATRFASDPERLDFGDGRGAGLAAKPSRDARPDPNDRGYAPVRLGIRPGMGGGDTFGVRVEGVSPGTSAEDGGILKGDVIVAWGGEDLVDVMDMVTRLREHKPGDVVPMVVLRDGKEIELDVKMKASERNIEN